ncbi:substrate-binding domain-containing protein [Nannocystaceae bacterium ST9]
MPEVRSKLREAREALGVGQAELAKQIGVSRQALGKLEAGLSQPNVSTALHLARALACSVEQLFSLDAASSVIECEGELGEGERVIVARVAGRWVAHALDELHGLVRSDGVVRGPSTSSTRWRVETTRAPEQLGESIVIAGCAPGLGVVVELARERGLSLRWLPCDSGRALRLLGEARVHLAGLHLYDDDADEYNAPQVRRTLPRAGLLAFTRWSAGLALAPDNPLAIRRPGDLCRARAQPRVARRQPGSGAGLLLRRQIGDATTKGPTARDHLDVARLIQAGAADAGITIEPIARAIGLTFLPLADERFDLAGAAETFADPRVVRLAELLAESEVQAQFAPFAGEDPRDAGQLTLL